MAAITLPRIIRAAGGALAELPNALAQCGLSRPFVVTDGFLAGNGMADRLTDILTTAGMAPRHQGCADPYDLTQPGAAIAPEPWRLCDAETFP